MRLPYLTTEFPGIGGTLKQRPEDFFVQEIPAYPPSGQGEHVFAEIEKINRSTLDAMRDIARALEISPRDIGYAGLKDARAIARQIVSIQGASPQAVMELKLPGILIRWADRHGNKLRLGHLAANRFAIKIRNVTPTEVVKLRPIINVLETRGMPNYFGEQRFGRRGENARLGAAMVRGDYPGLLHHLLGNPDPSTDDPDEQFARQSFDGGNYQAAMERFPRDAGMERRILHRLMQTENPDAAVAAIDQRLRSLWISALQSQIFNEVLARRIASIDRLMDGDIACKENCACFPVESAVVEQPRCDTFEISPTGPLVGYRMMMPGGEPLAIEQAALAALQLTPEHFRVPGRLKIRGARRPLRVRPKDTTLEGGIDEHGAYIAVAFTLPPGSYATVLLREITKSDSFRSPNQAAL